MGILNKTTSCAALCEGLLDFAIEEGKAISRGAAGTAAFRRGGSFPDFAAAEEEELEWLSKKDTFPSVETCFGILSDNPELVTIHHNSPVSVLQNALVVPTNFPARARRSRLGRKRRADFSKLFENNLETSASLQLPMRRRCLHCQVDTTPQWRAGPLGPKTLCNACGVRFKSGRLLPEYRPACSPTFSSTLHSNSHRKVVEMRKQKHVSTGGGGEF